MRKILPKKANDFDPENWFIQSDFDKLEKLEAQLDDLERSNVRKRVFGIMKNDGSVGSGSINMLTGERLLAGNVLTKRVIKPNQNFNQEAGQGVEQMLIKQNRQIQKHADSSDFIGIAGLSESSNVPLTVGSKI